MRQQLETQPNTDLFLWVRANLANLTPDLLTERLHNIDINAPINPETAREIIPEEGVSRLLNSAREYTDPSTNLYRVALFSALCTLPLTEELFTVLLQNNARINSICGITTPLNCAIYGNQSTVIGFLFRQGAKMNFAVWRSNAEMDNAGKKVLKDMKDSLTSELDTMSKKLEALGQSMFGANYAQIKAQFDADQRNKAAEQKPRELTLAKDDSFVVEHPLCLAARFNRLDIFLQLLHLASNEFDRVKDGSSILEAICQRTWEHDCTPYLDALLEAGVSILQGSKPDQIPLHIAITAQRPQVIEWLLQHGADAFKSLNKEKLSQLLGTGTDIKQITIRQMIKTHRTAVIELFKLARSDDDTKLKEHLGKLGKNHYLLNAPYSYDGKTFFALDNALAAKQDKNALLLIEYGAILSLLSAAMQDKAQELVTSTRSLTQ